MQVLNLFPKLKFPLFAKTCEKCSEIENIKVQLTDLQKNVCPNPVFGKIFPRYQAKISELSDIEFLRKFFTDIMLHVFHAQICNCVWKQCNILLMSCNLLSLY